MQEQTVQTTQTQTGYKVAVPTGPKAKSFRPVTDLALQAIRYRPGQTTIPTDSGPIAVFATLEDARRWSEHYPGTILEVEFVPSSERRLWKRNPPEFVRNSYGRGYHAVSTGISEKFLDDCPQGTVLADAVTPLRVVA